MRRTHKTGLILALAGAALALTACGSIPTREQRMKSPQTAMRGPAYKRLVVTFNEAHNLAVKAADYSSQLAAEGAAPEEVLAAQELADDAAKFADDIEWFLANRRRMQWHQSHMNKLWVRYDEMNPDHRGTVLAYTEKAVRKPSFKIELKHDYNEQYEIETPDPRWGDLFYPVGAKLYPGNPWSGKESSGQ
tara:strand:- start:4653 stop:5225 length:573 start_codon:yes stop_codon:yes gene_type:complete